jgi:succinylglutamate desuccinylase
MPVRSGEVMTFRGPNNGEGPVSLIMGGVHGNETPGIKAVDWLRENPPVIDQGTLHVVYGNPGAILAEKRFVVADLNRVFAPDENLSLRQRMSYERQRAEQLKPLIEGADVLLDMHGMGNPKCVPFIIAEPNAEHLYAQMPFDTVASGFDEHEPGGTDYYANKVGRIGICTENGYIGDPKATDKAIDGLKSFLSARGHIDETTEARQQRKFRIFDVHIAKQTVILPANIPDFERMEPGAEIGTEGANKLLTPSDETSYILFARAGTFEPGKETHVLARKVD